MDRRPSRIRILFKVLLAGLALAAVAVGLSASSDAQAPDSAAPATPPPAATTPPEATTPPATTTPEAAAPATTTPAKAPTPAERVAALKASLEKDRAALKQYQWTETTTMSLKGEVKSTTKMLCRYGSDGKVVKAAIGDAPPAEEKEKRGLRGKAAEKKKEEISDYMKKAAEAIKTYIPPDPEKLQVAKEAGKVSVTMLEPGKRARLDFKDYNIPGDNLGIIIDIVANKLLGVAVTTTIEGGKEPVNFAARYEALTDGTGYPAKTMLDAKEMGVTIAVENTDYKKKTP